MSEKRQIAKNTCRILCRAFENTFQYKSCFLLKHAIGNFVEGLLVEGTPYRNTFYAWSVICPTWHLGSEPKLDYGHRLLNGSYLVGDAAEVSRKIIAAIDVDDVARRRCCGPPTQVVEFFSAAEASAVWVTKLDVEAHNNLNHIFDKALLLLLYGDIRGGYAALSAYSRRGNGRGKYASVANDLIIALETKNDSWSKVIRDAQRRGQKAMGLDESDVQSG